MLRESENIVLFNDARLDKGVKGCCKSVHLDQRVQFSEFDTRARRGSLAHPDVVDCVVVGVVDDLKGQLPAGFLVLKVGAKAGNNVVVSQVVASIRKTIGPIAAFKSAVVVDRLPKIRSG
jgi:hypothetical protein